MFYSNILQYLISSILRIDFLRFFYGLIRGRKYVKRKISSFTECKSSIFIKNGEACDLYSPNLGQGDELHKTVKSQDIVLYAIENAVGSINGSSFYDQDRAYIEKIQAIDGDDALYTTGNLIYHDKVNAVFRVNENLHIEKNCLFLGGDGSFNYFHWLIEILPKLIYLEKDVIKKLNIELIAVSEKVGQTSAFKAALDILMDKIDTPVIYLPQDKDLSFRKVYYINSFNRVLFHPRQGVSRITDCVFSRTSLDLLRGNIFSSIYYDPKNFSGKSFPKKIFLMRGKVSDYNKRDYNQSEVLEFFKGKGFLPVFPEDYSLFEQAYLFNNAEQIVGPSGAFWSNLIFCSPGTIALSWLPVDFKEFSVYSSIAKFYMVEMRFVTYEAYRGLHSSYKIEVDEIKEIYDDLTLVSGFVA